MLLLQYTLVILQYEQLAPSVVGVCSSFSAGCGYGLENIPLKVLDVEVLCIGAVRGSGKAYDLAGGIIVEVQGVGISNVRGKLRALPDVAMSYTVYSLARTQTGLVIGKAQCVAALGHACQLPAALPVHRPAAIAQGVAYAVVCYLLAIVHGEQIAPDIVL